MIQEWLVVKNLVVSIVQYLLNAQMIVLVGNIVKIKGIIKNN